MSNVKTIPNVRADGPASVDHQRPAPRVSLNGRWATPSARPRLVSFSWAAVQTAHWGR